MRFAVRRARKKRLLLIAEHPITLEQAQAMKEQVEDRLKIEVVVVSGIRQALIVEEEA